MGYIKLMKIFIYNFVYTVVHDLYASFWLHLILFIIVMKYLNMIFILPVLISYAIFLINWYYKKHKKKKKKII